MANYFRNISFSRSLFYDINIMNFLNSGLICTPVPFILRKREIKASGLQFYIKRHSGTGVFQIFLQKLKGKHLCQSLFFNKVAGLKPATLLKKRLLHRCFPMNFAKKF